jgi:hypothetical protein
MGRNRSSRTSFVTDSVVRTSSPYIDNAFDDNDDDDVDNGNDDDDAFDSLVSSWMTIKDVPHLRAFFGIRPAKDFGKFVRIRSSTIEEEEEEFFFDFICSSSSTTRDGRIPVQTINSSRHAISV